jgi:hypothetical protein
MLPTARRENLTVKELQEETLVYDLEKNKAHCLNRTSALVWKHCDGRTSMPQLAALIEKTYHLPKATAVVELALEQLSKRNLLVEAVVPASAEARSTRREMLKDLGKKLAVAAAALPVIMTMTAPTARAAMSVCAVQCLNGNFQAYVPQCQFGVCNASCPVNFTGVIPGFCQR